MQLSSRVVVHNFPANPLACDGCGRLAGRDHLAQRSARLERSTRFRPVHIQVLFIAEAPPPQPEHEFYAESGASNLLLRALGIPSAGDSSSPAISERPVSQSLVAFQRLGLYLAYLIECPMDAKDLAAGAEALRSGAADLAERFSPTLLKRIRFSYRPKHIALLSSATRGLIPILEQAGWGQRLLLNTGSPWELTEAGNQIGNLAFRKQIEAVLTAGGSNG
jgi:hypothetical protein